MGLEENVAEIKDNGSQMWTLCTHAFYDLTHVSPVVFLFLLKECYYYGMMSSPLMLIIVVGNMGYIDVH